MEGKSKPGQSAVGGNQSINVKTRRIVKPGDDRDPRKLKAGGRILLPSKVNVPQGPAKPWKPPASSSGNSNKLVMDAYGNYLQSFLESALLKEMSNLQRMKEADSLALKCAEVINLDHQIKKVYADIGASNIYVEFHHLERIRSAFDNVAELTGEGVLIEIRNVLSCKYDKLRLKGAELNGPLFRANELEDILSVLRTRAEENDGSTVIMGWCSDFVEELKKLTDSSENANRFGALLEKATSALLEKCSLIACDNARRCEEMNGSGENLEQLTRTSTFRQS